MNTIGTNITVQHFADVANRWKEFAFFEVEPDSLDIRNPLVTHNLSGLVGRLPLTLHGSTMSLCSDVDVAAELLATVRQIARIAHSPLYSDHLSFTDAGDINLPLYMQPAYTNAVLRRTVEKIAAIKSQVPADFAFENVAQVYKCAWVEMDEPTFIRSVVTEADCAWILNVDSIVISANVLGVDPVEYVHRFPLSKVCQITAIPAHSHNPVIRERWGSLLDKYLWAVLEDVVAENNMVSVSIQHSVDAEVDSIMPDVRVASHIVAKYR